MICYYADGTNDQFNKVYPHKKEIKNIDDLKEVITHDYVAATYKDNKRSNDNFISSDCLMLDCDNESTDKESEWFTVETLKNMFPGVTMGIHFSRNNNKAKGSKSARPRFHVLFPIREVSDKEKYVELKKKALKLYPYFDPNATDAARFFYGTTEGECLFIEGYRTLDEFLDEGEEEDLDEAIRKHDLKEGNRNNHMSKFAAKIVKKYGIGDEARGYFDEEALKLDPPLEERELNLIWNSAKKFYKKVEASEGYVSPEEYASDWKNKLKLKKDGTCVNCLKNLQLILTNDPLLKNIVFNELADNMEVTGEIAWNTRSKFWRDADDSQLICYIDEKYGTFTKENYNNAVAKVVDDRSYHPIKNYFSSLPPWDKKPRVETLLIDYFGSEDNSYVRAVTRKTLVAAYRRVFIPGIKFDYMLVLNGPQGVGKSTLIGKLGMEWYADSLSISDMNDKTAAEKLQGYWIHEIGELAGMKKADIDKVKAFISRQDDKYRASFGRRVTPHPRQCIFFATTNAENGFLRDVTGNRRFWPVATPGTGTKKAWQITQEEIDQIWAEVIELAKKGENLYLDSEELTSFAEAEANKAMEADEREGLVRAYLDTLLPEDWYKLDVGERIAFLNDEEHQFHKEGTMQRTHVSNIEIWTECFGRKKEEIKQADGYAIKLIMKHITDWEWTGVRKELTGYGQQRVYERKK